MDHRIHKAWLSAQTYICIGCTHTRTICTSLREHRLAKLKCTHSHWHCGVTVKCKRGDYSLRRWEEWGGERSGGVLKGDRRGGGKRKERKNTRTFNMHKAWLLSFCWNNKTPLITACYFFFLFNSSHLFFTFGFCLRLWTHWIFFSPFICLSMCNKLHFNGTEFHLFKTWIHIWPTQKHTDYNVCDLLGETYCKLAL